LPAPSGTTDFDGRGYINRGAIETVRRDLRYCVEVINGLPPDAAGTERAEGEADSPWARGVGVPALPETGMEKRYEVFISSTFADLEQERSKVAQALQQHDFFPAGMEMFPASDDSQRKVILRAIERCDYYVVIVAGRYGSVNENEVSYTELEYDFAVKHKIPVLGFVHRNPDTIPQGKTDKSDRARKRLDAFRTKVLKKKMCDHWENSDELARKVVTAVSKAVKTHPRPGWVGGGWAARRSRRHLSRRRRRTQPPRRSGHGTTFRKALACSSRSCSAR
jgi:hypothetical protein